MNVVQIKTKVNSDTGEVLDKQESKLPNYFDVENGYRMFARTKSLRVFPAVDFPEDISRTDMGHLLFLTRSMWANTGCLGIIKNRKFKPFDDKGLYNHVGFTYDRKGKAWLKKMVNISMIRSIDVNLPSGTPERQWYINPIYFCPMFISRQSYLIWRDQIEKFMPEYVKRIFD